MEIISELSPQLVLSSAASARKNTLNDIIMMDVGPPSEDTLKKEDKETDTIMKLLLDNNKLKTIDDDNDKYVDNKAK